MQQHDLELPEATITPANDLATYAVEHSNLAAFVDRFGLVMLDSIAWFEPTGEWYIRQVFSLQQIGRSDGRVFTETVVNADLTISQRARYQINPGDIIDVDFNFHTKQRLCAQIRDNKVRLILFYGLAKLRYLIELGAPIPR